MIGTGIGLGLAGYRLRTSFEAMPSLDLQFADRRMIQAVLGPTPSFSRASTGTYFDSQGVLKSAAVNGPRFNHVYNGTSWVSRGLLVEDQRTNLVTNSEDLTNAGWTKTNATINANAVSAPDGLTTADEIVETTATGNHGSHSPVSTVGSGATFTASGFIKKKNKRYALFYVTDNATQNISVLIDMDNGTIVGNGSGFGADAAPTSSSITNVGNGWYRISITRTNSVGQASARVGAYLTDDSGSLSTGFSYAGSTSNGIYAWGFQIEAGSTAASYISTTTASVVRSASVCQLTGTDFSAIWNGSEGTLVVEGDSVANGTTPFMSLDDNTSSERIEIYGSGTDPKVLVVDGGSTQVDIDAGTISNGTTFKLAFAYKANDFAVSLNGGTVATDTAGTLPIVDRLRIGSNQAGNYFNGHIARLRYYSTRLTNAKLQELST